MNYLIYRDTMQEIEEYLERAKVIYGGLARVIGHSTYVANSPKGFYALEIAVRKPKDDI